MQIKYEFEKILIEKYVSIRTKFTVPGVPKLIKVWSEMAKMTSEFKNGPPPLGLVPFNTAKLGSKLGLLRGRGRVEGEGRGGGGGGGGRGNF